MVEIVDKSRCTGCTACVSVCPKEAIRLERGRLGLLYPTIDVARCIDCGRCQAVCPALNTPQQGEMPEVWAAKSPSQALRMESSSGGVFTLLAEEIIRRGGVVYGAAWNEAFNVAHCRVEKSTEIARLRGSKYQQSDLNGCFAQVKADLKAGREVLFSGTPCQVAGLNNFLGHPSKQLLCVDVVCHGAPAPAVWQAYLKSINPSGEEITRVNMRNKRSGWQRSRFRIESSRRVVLDELSSRNRYMQGFLQDLFLRPSCHRCPTKGSRAQSDITLGDYWGIHRQHPDFADYVGVSLVLVNTPKGGGFFDALDLLRHPSTLEQALQRNPGICHSAKENPLAEEFACRFEEAGIEEALKLVRMRRPSLFKRLTKRIKQLFDK